MKISIKMLAATAILGVFAAASVAQEAGPQGGAPVAGKGGRQGGGMGMGMRMMREHQEEMMKALKLTPEQKKKVEALQKKTMEDMMALRKESKGDRQVMREKAMKMRGEHNKALMAILTPAQQKIYKEKSKEFMEKMKKERGQGGGFGGGKG